MRNLSILGKSDQAQSVAPGETTQVIIMASSLLSTLLCWRAGKRGETQVEVVTLVVKPEQSEKHLCPLFSALRATPGIPLVHPPGFWPDARRASPQPGPGATVVVGIFSIESSSRGPGDAGGASWDLARSLLPQWPRGVTSWARLSALGWFPCRRSPHCTLPCGSDGSSNVSCCEMLNHTDFKFFNPQFICSYSQRMLCKERSSIHEPRESYVNIKVYENN